MREIMSELVVRSSAVVQRYSGTVDKFTGDGIMAVFGAPAALEDHAFAPVWRRSTSSRRWSAWQLRWTIAMAWSCSCGLD